MSKAIYFGVNPANAATVAEGINGLHPVVTDYTWNYWDIEVDPQETDNRLVIVRTDAPERDIYTLLTHFGPIMVTSYTGDRMGNNLLLVVVEDASVPPDNAGQVYAVYRRN